MWTIIFDFDVRQCGVNNLEYYKYYTIPKIKRELKRIYVCVAH